MKIRRERLLLEVWTDGSVTPAVAVGEASRILQDHFNLLTDFPDAMPEEEEPGATRRIPAPSSTTTCSATSTSSSSPCAPPTA